MFATITIIALGIAVALVIVGLAVSTARKSSRGTTIVPPTRLSRLLLMFAGLSLAAMTVTGFVPAFGAGHHDWLMLIHASLAPLFLVSAALTAILWREWRRPLLFGLMILVALASSASILAAMSAWADTDAQLALYDVHRYSALALLALAILYCGSTLSLRRRAPRGADK